MNDHPHNRPGGARPSVAEIAALTRRPRELSAPGRTVDPRERAAFLADKDALIARITDTTDADSDAADTDAGGEGHEHLARTGRTDQASEEGWWARAESTDPTVEAVTFDAAGYYSDARLAAIAQARAAGDTERAERLQNAPWSTPADDERAPEMPEWMREQARRTEAEIADGTYVAGPPDDMARFADRLAELREQTDPDAAGRRDQLARWHRDDAIDVAATDGDTPGWYR
ncbi:hypothetical protein GCM10017691_46650 [Pseudonocardia petroleophila]|uniref:Uncharacterized protein n=1 Tax=Pseudonocardia petroleophila TaxID=37331 RepID=A0A7G7MQR8_9PSEU|nr:hypothetical protein [Pseudonocardia petroleophila]QNG55129.1 hypothetical protein H6H00_15455 [Pseudonocardia petroleophila]